LFLISCLIPESRHPRITITKAESIVVLFDFLNIRISNPRKEGANFLELLLRLTENTERSTVATAV